MITWSAWNQTRFTDGPGNHTLSAVTKLNTLQSTLVDVTNIAHDMFCPGAWLDNAARVFHDTGVVQAR